MQSFTYTRTSGSLRSSVTPHALYAIEKMMSNEALHMQQTLVRTSLPANPLTPATPGAPTAPY